MKGEWDLGKERGKVCIDLGFISVRMKSSGWLSSRPSVYGKESMGPGEHEPLRGPASTRRLREERQQTRRKLWARVQSQREEMFQEGVDRGVRCGQEKGGSSRLRVGRLQVALARAVPGAPGGKAGLQRVKE